MALEYVRRIYTAFMKSEWKWPRIFAIIVFIANVPIPAYHSFTAKIPPDGELLKTEGELFFKSVSNDDNLTGLRTHSGDVLFTCENTFFSSKDCVKTDNIKQSIQGRQATVYWFRQPSYLWIHKNRLAELWVGSDVVVSRAVTQRRINISKETWIWIIPAALLLFIGVDALLLRINTRRKKQQE